MRKMAPTTYILEEYEPRDMDGVMILKAKLIVKIDKYGEAVVEDVIFDGSVPFVFKMFLIKAIHEDDKLMNDIEEACCVEYETND